MQTVVDGRIVEDHPRPEDPVAITVEEVEALQAKAGAVTMVEAILEVVVVEGFQITMDPQQQPHKLTLFR